MMPPDLERQLAFLREIDRLKSIVRLTPLIDRSRRENSAEHSWHLAMYALVLAEHAACSIDILRVVKMLLIHDIVEIDAGDVPFHAPETHAGQQARANNRPPNASSACCHPPKPANSATSGTNSKPPPATTPNSPKPSTASSR